MIQAINTHVHFKRVIREENSAGVNIGGDEIVEEYGEVLSVGEQVKTVKVGDTILFKGIMTDSVMMNDEIEPFIEEKYILGICKDTTTT